MLATQANVEYWFRLLYECIHGACYGSINTTELYAWLAHLWVWIVVIGYLLSVVAFIVIIYCTIRIFELRKREEEFYNTLIVPPELGGANPRWQHIESLMESTNVGDWRTAIIEADIMLEDLLTKEGYPGEGVGEKLKSTDRATFGTLDDAWEAHKVRNQIAHQGVAFDLTDSVARRTIARYENVFTEFKII